MNAEAEILADKFEKGIFGLCVEGETPTILIAVSGPQRDMIVSGLRAEIVAWRWRQFDHGPWCYSEERPNGPSIHLFRVEALYTGRDS